MAEINQAIGATGVVSNECKMVVKQYGDQIVEMLLDQVTHFTVLLFKNVQLRFHDHAILLKGENWFLIECFSSTDEPRESMLFAWLMPICI